MSRHPICLALQVEASEKFNYETGSQQEKIRNSTYIFTVEFERKCIMPCILGRN